MIMKIAVIAGLTATLVCVSLSSPGQVYKYKAFQFTMEVYDANGNDTYPNKWDSTDILVVVNSDKNKIKIYSKQEQDIDMVSLVSTKKDDDDNTFLVYKCVDGEGKDCRVKFYIYKDQTQVHKETLTVQYSDMAFIYRLRDDD
jgi:hypothetical protein